MLPFENFRPENQLVPEIVGHTKVYNLSSESLSQAVSHLPHELQGAGSVEKVVFLPDLCPGRSPLPTGCHIEIDPNSLPEWRRYAVSDVGCGMQVLRSDMSLVDFEKDGFRLWESVLDLLRRYKTPKSQKAQLGDLGGGNHFLDAAADPDGRVYFVIHTGSRDESAKAEDLIDQPDQFDSAYASITQWAADNRTTIAGILRQIYGPLDTTLDKTHNFYTYAPNGNALIYKGAVRLLPGEQTIIPSSMDGGMVIVTGTSQMGTIDGAMSHGTGRVKGRSDSKVDCFDFDSLRRRIYIPHTINNRSIRTENPSCYRQLDHCLPLISDLVTVATRLDPIAYIGQI